MKTFLKYYTESKLEGLKSFVRTMEFDVFDPTEWIKEKEAKEPFTKVVPFGLPTINSYKDLEDTFGKPYTFYIRGWNGKPRHTYKQWGIKFKDGLTAVITSSYYDPPSATILSDSPKHLKEFTRRIYNIFNDNPETNEFYTSLTENNKLSAFKQFAGANTVKKRFDAKPYFPQSAEDIQKLGMDYYTTEMVIDRYDSIIDLFGEPDYTSEGPGRAMFLEWGVEFNDGVKVILSIEAHDLNYDDENNVIPDSPAVAQITGPVGREEEILERLDHLLNKR
jgi:hypothetical protein